MKKFNFSYDKKNDDLFLYNPDSKSKGCLELGEIIFDYNTKKELVGIQIMNASKILQEISEKEIIIIKEILSNLKESILDIKTKENMLIIKLYLISNLNKISPIISIPKIEKSSPSLAYV
jgi:uncharacterized protein YuzE